MEILLVGVTRFGCQAFWWAMTKSFRSESRAIFLCFESLSVFYTNGNRRQEAGGREVGKRRLNPHIPKRTSHLMGEASSQSSSSQPIPTYRLDQRAGLSSSVLSL